MTGEIVTPTVQTIKPGKFLYVFTTVDRDKLMALGLEMMREDNFRSVFVFQNDPDLFPDNCDVEYVTTNRLFF